MPVMEHMALRREEAHKASVPSVAPQSAPVTPQAPQRRALHEPPRVPAHTADHFGRGFPIAQHGISATGHANPAAGRLSTEMGADAVTVGTHVFFAPGAYTPGTEAGDALIRHELAHVAQAPSDSWAIDRVAPMDGPHEAEAELWAAGRVGPVRHRAEPGTAFRHAVVRTTAQHHTEADIVGPAATMTLAQFDDWSQVQLDFFIGLTATTRLHLWTLHAMLREGPHVRAGLGAILVRELVAQLALGNADPLRWYANGSRNTTLRITTPTTSAATAVDHGTRIHQLEGLIGAASLNVAWTQADFVALAGNPAQWTLLLDYFTRFRPHMERRDEMAMVTGFLARGGAARFTSLVGRMRNLHRFPDALLTDQVRLWGTSGVTTPPVFLVVHSGHDWNGALVHTDTVTLPPMARDPRFRLLIMEGMDTLANATALVASVGASYGRIQQVLIIGHGESRFVEMAGTGTPSDQGQYARYPQQALDLGPGAATTPDSQAFFDTLLRNMDPARARVVFAGCLLGTTSVPQLVPDGSGGMRAPTAAEIRAFYSDPNRIPMGEWLQSRPAAIGLRGFGGSFVQAARADTGLASATGFVDAAGRAAVQYPLDAHAFGGAADYVLFGQEPTGVLRAIREVMVRSPARAPALVARRVASPPPTRIGWWCPMANLMARVAQPAVVAGDLVRVNRLEQVAGDTFQALFDPVGKRVALARLSAADAGAIFPTMLSTSTAPIDRTRMDLTIHQAWASIDSTRVPAFATALDTTTLALDQLEQVLLPRTHNPAMQAALLPVPTAAPTPGQLRLVYIRIKHLPARTTPPGPGDDRELQLLYPHVAPTRTLPAGSAAMISGFTDTAHVLAALGLGPTPTRPPGPPPGPTGPTDLANVRLGGTRDTTNDAWVHGPSYMATVTVGANVRPFPNMSRPPIGGMRRGTTVRVLGFVHSWAAIEFATRRGIGRLGFIHRNLLSAPPP